MSRIVMRSDGCMQLVDGPSQAELDGAKVQEYADIAKRTTAVIDLSSRYGLSYELADATVALKEQDARRYAYGSPQLSAEEFTARYFPEMLGLRPLGGAA